MSYLLNLFYALFLTMASPWLLWRAVFQNKSRRGWWQKLFGLAPDIEKDAGVRRVWFHAVSVGEVNLLKPLIDRISARDSTIEFVISTSTETGFDLAKKKFSGQPVFFCPMDFTWSVKNTLKRIKPDLLVLTELELWPNLITVTARHRIPVMVANARLSASSFRGYRRLGWLVRRVLKKIDLIAVQNETYETRFIELGCRRNRVVVTGNIKFDGAQTRRDCPVARELRSRYSISSNEHVFVAGSTQPDEDRMVVEVYHRLAPGHEQLRLVLVPRHPEKVEAVCDYMKSQGISFRRRSERREQLPKESETGRLQVIVVDVIGELASWWTMADVGYVGGSLGPKRGGQNMIEPAALGVPVSFGPSTRNFQAVVESLLAVNGATIVRNEVELADFVSRSLADPETVTAQADRAKQVVLGQQGAADATVGLLLQRLPQRGLEPRRHALPAA